VLWLHNELHVDMPVVCPMTQKIIQPFHDTIAQAFKWGMPQPKREPYTHQMIATFYCQARALIQSDPQNNYLVSWQFLTGSVLASLQAAMELNIVKLWPGVMKYPESQPMASRARMQANQ